MLPYVLVVSAGLDTVERAAESQVVMALAWGKVWGLSGLSLIVYQDAPAIDRLRAMLSWSTASIVPRIFKSSVTPVTLYATTSSTAQDTLSMAD